MMRFLQGAVRVAIGVTIAGLFGMLLMPDQGVRYAFEAQPISRHAAAETLAAREYALDYACGAMEVDYETCMALGVPEVRFAELRRLLSANGYYWPALLVPGSANRVWLDVSLEDDVRQPDDYAGLAGYKTLVHEVVHYIDYNLGTYESSCDSERKAWHVSNLFLLEHEREDLAVWHWWDYYDKCTRPEAE